MHTLHRIYSWLIFPIIATVFIAMLILQLIFRLLQGFTYEAFFHQIPPPPEVPGITVENEAQFSYIYRLMFAFTMPFGEFASGLKDLANYKI